VGKKVKTRHVRYIGKYGYRSSGSSGGLPGFQPPVGLTAKRKEYVDKEISKLKQGKEYPYELEILRQYLYHHDFEFLGASGRQKPHLLGYVIHTLDGEVTSLGLQSKSGRFTWIHELGHALEFADKLLDDELTGLRFEFLVQVDRAYRQAQQDRIEGKALFMQRFGKLINIRQTLDSWAPDSKPVENDFIYTQLERIQAGEIPESAFNHIFESWVRKAYRLSLEEIFADSVSALILNPKYAFEAHGAEGRKYLSKLYVRLYRHLEEKYQLSLGRPKNQV
jgi:hypothetical protein